MHFCALDRDFCQFDKLTQAGIPYLIDSLGNTPGILTENIGNMVGFKQIFECFNQNMIDESLL